MDSVPNLSLAETRGKKVLRPSGFSTNLILVKFWSNHRVGPHSVMENIQLALNALSGVANALDIPPTGFFFLLDSQFFANPTPTNSHFQLPNEGEATIPHRAAIPPLLPQLPAH